MDAGFSDNGHAVMLSDPRVEGVEIVSLEPIQNWPGPTICMQRNGEWVCLPARLILKKASAA